MSDDLLLRLAVVVAVGGAALGVGLLSRRGLGLVRRGVVIPGHGPGLVFFSSSTCASCSRMRERLVGWPEVEEVTYEEAGGGFPDVIDRVPALALLDAAGRGWVAYGIVSPARLERWIAAGP